MTGGPRTAHDNEKIAKTLRGLAKEKKGLKTHASELVEQIVAQFGGADQVALQFVNVFRESSQQVQARMLDTLLRLMLASGIKDGDLGDLSKLSDEQLEQVAAQIMAKNREVIGGEAGTATVRGEAAETEE